MGRVKRSFRIPSMRIKRIEKTIPTDSPRRGSITRTVRVQQRDRPRESKDEQLHPKRSAVRAETVCCFRLNWANGLPVGAVGTEACPVTPVNRPDRRGIFACVGGCVVLRLSRPRRPTGGRGPGVRFAPFLVSSWEDEVGKKDHTTSPFLARVHALPFRLRGARPRARHQQP